MKIELGAQLGDFELLQFLGRGGMGEVWIAERHPTIDMYALKILPEKLGKDEFFVSGFQRRAEIIVALKHPRLVQLRQFGRFDGLYFLAMDFIEGPAGPPLTLAELAAKIGGPMPEADVRRFMLQICEGLDYAHHSGAAPVAHLDLKPHNILIDAKGEARITDLGMVKLVTEKFVRDRLAKAVVKHRQSLPMHESPSADDSSDSRSFREDDAPLPISRPLTSDEAEGGSRSAAGHAEPKTSRAALCHTNDYLSPEQREKFLGDARSDLYALGLIAYRLLTGKLPDDPRKAPSKLVRGIRPFWDEMTNRCLNPLPERRPADVRDVIRLLGGIPGTWEPPPKSARAASKTPSEPEIEIALPLEPRPEPPPEPSSSGWKWLVAFAMLVLLGAAAAMGFHLYKHGAFDGLINGNPDGSNPAATESPDEAAK